MTETALTNAGRGRLPLFEMELRTQILNRGMYSYEKASFGSYKDYVPSHYDEGYFITTHVRRKYGALTWSNVLDRVARNPLKPFPFSHALKKETGKGSRNIYKETFIELDSLWKMQDKQIQITTADTINKIKKISYTNYLFAQYLNDSMIVAEKSGLGNIKNFVVIDREGNEKTVFVPGTYESTTLSVVNNKIVWAEIAFDKRWVYRDYSVIKIVDLKTQRRKTLTRKTRLFAPAFSPDGSKIVAVEVTESYQCSLVILDAQTGKELKRLDNSRKDFYMTPRWSDDGKQLIAVVLNDKGKSIVSIDPKNSTYKEIIPYTFYDISNPSVYFPYVFYNGSYSGIANIYAANLVSGKIYQVTSRRSGAIDAAVSADGKKLAFSDYTALGYNIAEMDILPGNWIPIENISDQSIQYYKPLVEQESGGNVFKNIPDEKYEIKKYKKGLHLFNFHSWAPASINLNSQQVTSGVSLISQDVLSSTITSLNYEFNNTERTGNFSANVNYMGWYPVINFSVRDGIRSMPPPNYFNTQDYSFREKTAIMGITLPLNLTTGKYESALTTSANANFIDVTHLSDTPADLRNGNLYVASSGINFNRLLKTSPRDLNPKWGQIISLNYEKTFLNSDYKSALFASTISLFFPGILPFHSLKISSAYQNEKAENYYIGALVTMPRGYKFSSDIYEDFYKFSFDYKIPLFYPDKNIGFLAYIKRIKLGLFFDFAQGRNNGSNENFESTGIELTTDTHFLRYFYPVDWGIRETYVPGGNFLYPELLFQINFNQLPSR
jgi:Tol biopolymer transport system component